jgi:hypothetical protein
MIYMSGRFSLMTMVCLYGVVGIFLVLRRDNAHRVQIFHSQAYIDCDVDGDSDTHTCVSDFTVIKAFSFNTGYVFGATLILSAIITFARMCKQRAHVYSMLSYLDAVINNTMMTIAVAVVTGIQGLSTLVLMTLNTIMYETGIYLHDRGYWESKANTPYNNRGRLLTLITLNAITMSVNIASLVDYWSVSDIPVFIPFILISWIICFGLLRYFTVRYFYGTLPVVLRKGNGNERDTLFNDTQLTKYDVISKEDPYIIDWHESWKNGIIFFSKMVVAVSFYVGTNNIKIYYK